MLFQKDGAPIRLQGAYVSGEELKAIANYIRENNASHFSKEAEESICMEPKEEEEEDEVRENDRENDPYFVEALKLAVTTGNASISMLQRKFRIGFRESGKYSRNHGSKRIRQQTGTEQAAYRFSYRGSVQRALRR